MLLTSNAQKGKKYENHLNPIMLVFIRKLSPLTEYYQMSTHLQWFQSFLSFLSSFYVDQISNQQWKG